MLIRDGVSKISNILYTISCWLIKIILVLMVLTTALQIICRVFFSALSWSEELTRYLLVWSTFLGAGCVFKTHGHISVLVFQNLLSPQIKKGIKVLVNLLCLLLFGIAAFYGFKYMSMQGNQLSSSLRIPMKYIYFSIPLGFSMMIVYAFDNILRVFFAKGESEA